MTVTVTTPATGHSGSDTPDMVIVTVTVTPPATGHSDSDIALLLVIVTVTPPATGHSDGDHIHATVHVAVSLSDGLAVNSPIDSISHLHQDDQ